MNPTATPQPSPARPRVEACRADRPRARSGARRALALTLWLALSVALGHAAYAAQGGRQLALYLVGVAMGVVLLRTGFGFAGSFRRFLTTGDGQALRAPLPLIGFTTLLFAPVLAAGEALGQVVGPAAAPVAVQVLAGAFLFGVGMQLGGGCGSGTLFSLGGGNGRMLVVVLLFCAGSFAASLHMDWWGALPGVEAIVLGEAIGWAPAAVLQIAVIAGLWWLLGKRSAAPAALGMLTRAAGMWPSWVAIGALGMLNLATLVLAGHPWTITWAYALWGAKAAVAVGWDPAASPFWQAPLQSQALAGGLLEDVTSMMDIALVVGAAGAALAAGRWQLRFERSPGALLSAVLGGLLMGYGARIAYGCTIGALLSGAASTSLHGWLWLAAALPGSWLGARLRPRFGLAG